MMEQHYAVPESALKRSERIERDLWALARELSDELEKLKKILARSGNYVADKEREPQSVTFENGRRVRIAKGARGKPYLEIDKVKTRRRRKTS